MTSSGAGSGRLEGKVALITGAARGQGAAEAAQFVREGARVVVTDLLDEPGEAVARNLGERARYRRLDVSDEQSWAGVVAEVVEVHGGLDVLVNNAAITGSGALDEMSLDAFDRMYRINQRGVLLGMRAVVAPMRRAGGGSIVNVASAAVFRALPGLIGYSATKFAVRGMTKVAAAELARDNIRVNVIHPGLIDTPMRDEIPEEERAKRPGVPVGRLGESHEVAHLATFLASDESSYITGGDFVVDGGLVL
jgi:3alpha(or 20beta)-hydroxysteroid dehydrogenase